MNNAVHTYPVSQYVSPHKKPGLHCSPRAIKLQDIDVVADAEAIKTLLKLPYLSEPISMIVHRVGNTVLIDDFDLERLFCRYKVC